MNPTQADDLDSTDRLPAIESDVEGDAGAGTGTWQHEIDQHIAELQATVAERDAEIADLTGKLAAALSAGAAPAAAAQQAETIAVDDDGSLAQRVAVLTTELARRDDRIRMLEADLAVHAAALDTVRRGLGMLSELKARPAAPVAGEVEPRWLARLDDGSGRLHVLTHAHCTVGRTPDNDVQVPEAYMSRCHALFDLSAGTTTVEDAGSTNGVFVNNQRVRSERLEDGDLVSFGKAHFRFHTRQPGN